MLRSSPVKSLNKFFMIKRFAWMLLTGILLLGLCGCNRSERTGKLVVNGRELPEGSYVRIYPAQEYAEIPALAVMRALGYEAEVRHNPDLKLHQVVIDQEYVLFSSDDAETVPGDFAETVVRRVEGNEYIIDTKSVSTFLYWGWDIDIKVDYRKGVVYVDSYDPWAYTEKPYRLIVNGKNISEQTETVIREYYTEQVEVIPVVSVLRELGATVEWENNTVATVCYAGKSFTFNLEDEDFGYLSPPGGVGVREASDGEIYMEYASVHYFLTEFMDAKIRYNPLTDTIRINDK